MPEGKRIAFTVTQSEIRNGIYTPKYYDPDLDRLVRSYGKSHELVTIAELLNSGELEMRQGNYIGKMNYGTGEVPYIRTSDIANWELRGSPKHGVSQEVAEIFRAKQNVTENDVLLVHEGTYLIGTACLLTRFDLDILYQHHLARLRVLDNRRVNGPLLMCALMSDVVQRQIRSRQFTADVIDSIVGRFPEVKIPIPRQDAHRQNLSERAKNLFRERAEARVQLAVLRRSLNDALLTGNFSGIGESVGSATEMPGVTSLMGFLGVGQRAESFTVKWGDIRNSILLPRYYDPISQRILLKMAEHNDLVTIGDLVKAGTVRLETGTEVGKLAYGTGPVAFVRTSDLGNWELKSDPKQRVAQWVYDATDPKASATENDILLVRDGTYLVGTSAMVTNIDTPMLYSGGVYRIRVLRPENLDPFLLLALINTPIAGRQMKNKQFTRDVIDTLGRRIEEVVLPIPRQPDVRIEVASIMQALVMKRKELRARVARLGDALVASDVGRAMAVLR